MARTIASRLDSLIGPDNSVAGFQLEELPEGPIEVLDPNKGMFSNVPRTQIPTGGFLLAQNARVSGRGIRRRDGSSLYADVPDTDPVVLVVGEINAQSISRVLRVTPNSVHYSVGGSDFTQYPDSGVTWNGAVLRPSAASFLDDTYIGGFHHLLRVNYGQQQVEEVTEGPQGARFLTNFADRIVAAHIGDDSYKIAWCANADPLDWISESAGEENLVQAPSDIGDAINGIFGLESAMVILRRQSIWLATRQPFAARPFRFDSVHSGIGCDLPYSAVRVPGGLIFADRRTRGVYFYQLGGVPQRISRQIEKELFDDIVGSGYWVQGTFDWRTMSYVLGIPPDASSKQMEKFWIFSLLEGAWTYDDNPPATSLGSYLVETVTFIDDLEGNIDDLEGTIEELSQRALPFRLYRGHTDGEVTREDETSDTDYDSVTPVAFTFALHSQNLGGTHTRRTMVDLMLTTEYNRAGSVLLDQSIDRSNWRNTKTIALSGNRVSLKRNPISGNDLYWRLRATTSDVLITSWWARIHEKGYQR